MKYAVHFNRNFQYKELTDEMILKWRSESDIVKYVIETFPQETRVTINFEDQPKEEIEKAIPILAKLKKEHPKIAVRFRIKEGKDYIEDLKKFNIDFYFIDYCSSLDMLFGQVQLGVSDVYIAEELAFDLKNVSNYCKPFGVQIRVYPDVAQSGGAYISEQIPDLMKFFIRPEDTNVYEKFVDVFEFWNKRNLNTIFKIYYSRQWLGNLNEIITNFNREVSNTGLTEYYATVRSTCKKKCMYGRCSICLQMANLSNEMEKQGYEIETERIDIRNELRLNKEALSDGRESSEEYDNETSTSEEL